jgi:hypothetical protein
MIYRNECHYCGKRFPSTHPLTACLPCAEARGLGWPPREPASRFADASVAGPPPF